MSRVTLSVQEFVDTLQPVRSSIHSLKIITDNINQSMKFGGKCAIYVCLPCSEGLMEDFLSICHAEKCPQRAVQLVQLSAAFCLSVTPRLATRVLAEFDLTDEHR